MSSELASVACTYRNCGEIFFRGAFSAKNRGDFFHHGGDFFRLAGIFSGGLFSAKIGGEIFSATRGDFFRGYFFWGDFFRGDLFLGDYFLHSVCLSETSGQVRLMICVTSEGVVILKCAKVTKTPSRLAITL